MYGEDDFIYVIVMRIPNIIINPSMVLVSKLHGSLSDFSGLLRIVMGIIGKIHIPENKVLRG